MIPDNCEDLGCQDRRYRRTFHHLYSFKICKSMPQLLEPEQLYPKSHFQRSLDHAQETMHPVADYLQRAADGRGKKCKSEMNDARDTTSDDQQDTIHF